MKPDPDYEGIGVGPNPEPEPGNCPFDGEEMNVGKRINENSDAFITTFIYECPDCGAKFRDGVGS